MDSHLKSSDQFHPGTVDPPKTLLTRSPPGKAPGNDMNTITDGGPRMEWHAQAIKLKQLANSRDANPKMGQMRVVQDGTANPIGQMQVVQDGTANLELDAATRRLAGSPKRPAAELGGSSPKSRCPRQSSAGNKRAGGSGKHPGIKPGPDRVPMSPPAEGPSYRKLGSGDRTFKQKGAMEAREALRRKRPSGVSQQDVGPSLPRDPRSEPILDRSHSRTNSLGVDRNVAVDTVMVTDDPIVEPKPPPEEPDETLVMVRQPETRPISPEQLIAEVKGIYSGLIMVEKKCFEVDEKQHQAALEMDGNQPKLNNEQWQALIALHRTLLHEHHDFFLASQHPSASPSLKKLAQKYAMPARMWRHGIHSFLELLRHRLPLSLEHMLTFIYLAYSMMTILYETVPAFEDTWIECLGDLARYRMAIEEDDPRDREVWQNVARSWYSKASDNTPTVGRLYHHLAILARPNILQQLFYYCKSLGVSQPFTSARESILTVFDPIFNPEILGSRSQPVDSAFIQLHSITFTHIEFEKFDTSLEEFLTLLDKQISKQAKWKVQGFYMAVCNITALFQYGSRESLLRKAYKEGRKADDEMDDAPDATETAPAAEQEKSEEAAAAATDQDADPNNTIQGISLNVSKRLGYSILELSLQRTDDSNVLPHLHAWMIFLWHITGSAPAMQLLEKDFPWQRLVDMLNELRAKFDKMPDRDAEATIHRETFPAPSGTNGRPLAEDYSLRGLDWVKRYFPERWFLDAGIDAEERNQELPSMTATRMERILWLTGRICAAADWIKYENLSFSVHPALLNRIEAQKRLAAMELTRKKKTEVGVDTDVEMEARPCSDSEDGEYLNVVPELARLVEKKKELEAQLDQRHPRVVTPATIAEVTRSALAKGSEALRKDITAFIVDTNLLISHLETFNFISNNGWCIIIPNTVLTELHGLGRNTGSVGDSAKSALIAINKAITDHHDIKVITAKGSDVTRVGHFSEKLDKADEGRSIDDIIINIAEAQAELRRKMFAERQPPIAPVEPVIILTEDINMRVKANARHVPAISTTNLKRFMVQLGVSDPRPVAGGSQRPPRVAKPKPVSIQPKIRDDSIEEPPDSPNRNRRKQLNRQGRRNSFGRVNTAH